MADKYSRIDICKVIAALFVISIHTDPLATYSEGLNFIVTRIFGRLAVPFFFVSAGYFFFKNPSPKKLYGYSKKISLIYLASIIIYLPVNFYAGHFHGITAGKILSDIIFNGTFYHLWFLPALIIGIVICYILLYRVFDEQQKSGRYNPAVLIFAISVTLILYAIGLMGDSYFGLTSNNRALLTIYEHIFVLSDYTRNGLFFAPVFIAMGALLALKGNASRSWLFYLFFALYCIETTLLARYNIPRHDSMTIFLVPASYFLFKNILYFEHKNPTSPFLRSITLWIYVLHPLFIIVVRAIGKIVNAPALIENSLIHYIFVTFFTFAASYVIINIKRFTVACRNKTDTKKLRAYAEINLSNATHNLNEVRRILGNGIVMAVVKAEAYGHGSVKLSKHLNKLGVKHFAVAEIDEAIRLRKSGVKGEILILGFTPVCRRPDILRYNLTQTIYSLKYAEQLAGSLFPVKVHIKIDTGMNRLGLSFNDKQDILRIYKLKGLKFKGIFSHLSRADSLSDEDIKFTELQIKRFDDTLKLLKDEKIDVGLTHLQSTYGVLNYGYLKYDMVRCGLALFGILSREDTVRCDVSLKPILSLKAKVTDVKSVHESETVGYNKSFTAKRDLKIAVISIGYGDGYPRMLTGQNANVLINGSFAPVIGNINMDSLIADVTELDDILPETVVTLIGTDNNNTIKAYELSQKCGTINNELLSRIGSRVYRVFLDK